MLFEPVSILRRGQNVEYLKAGFRKAMSTNMFDIASFFTHKGMKAMLNKF